MKKTLLTSITLLMLAIMPIQSMAFGYTFNQGYLLSIDSFDELVMKGDNVKLNNFILTEEDAWLSKKLNNLKFSCSARNKNNQSKHFSIMVVGLSSENQILWAMNAEPSMSTLSANYIETIEAEVYVLDGLLRQTAQIWIKVALD